jgi:hypothetical protein
MFSHCSLMRANEPHVSVLTDADGALWLLLLRYLEASRTLAWASAHGAVDQLVTVVRMAVSDCAVSCMPCSLPYITCSLQKMHG